eukprot:312561-Amphidinium_carterae.1
MRCFATLGKLIFRFYPQGNSERSSQKLPVQAVLLENTAQVFICGSVSNVEKPRRHSSQSHSHCCLPAE